MHGSIEGISSLMQADNRSYAAYFNARHDRVGHLMQGRFHSVPVKDDAQLVATVVYIHRNPVEAGLSEGCRYKWSSYGHYLEADRPVGMRRVLEEVSSDDKAKRNEILSELRCRGLSIRQIERLTGIGRNIIANAK